MTIGSSGEAIFNTRRPDIASAALYLMDSVPAKASFPEINIFIQRCMPSFRRRQEMVHDFLRRKLALSRAAMASKGDAGVQMADNTLGGSERLSIRAHSRHDHCPRTAGRPTAR